MGDFFQIIAAGPFFFVSSWVLMISPELSGPTSASGHSAM